MLLIEAQKYLDVVRQRGEAGTELKRVYYNIATNRDLYLMAYVNLYANTGALTPGIIPDETVDGMSLKRIEAIMEKVTSREYIWTPVRRTYILKKDGRRKRPLGMPGWNDKMLQEVIRLVLNAYYETQFRDCSHGFRPHRGCHKALDAIRRHWQGIHWFIEGDIKGCYDNLSHTVILSMLHKHIKDNTFLAFMKDAGYYEDWVLHRTYSGTPQGGIVSPTLANIVLHELDVYVEDVLISQYTKGTKRKNHPENNRLRVRANSERKKGNYVKAKELRDVYTKLPTQVYEDPDYRRLRYIRYADDILFGFVGTKVEAEAIKDAVSIFVQGTIELELSDEKTVITNAAAQRARFLNYEMGIVREDRRKTKTVRAGIRTQTRSINGHMVFYVPKDVTQEWKARITRGKKIWPKVEFIHLSDYDIISKYEAELQGLINYYSFAQNVKKEMYKLRYYYRGSLLRTLAAKRKTSVHKIRQRYTKYMADGRKVITVEIPREGKKSLRAIFGKTPIQRKKSVTFLRDDMVTIYTNRNELLNRLLGSYYDKN